MTRFTLPYGAMLAGALVLATVMAHGAVLQDPDAPAMLGEDSRILGDRSLVKLTRWADTPGDSEAMYLVSIAGREIGFARPGDQCMDGKLGGAVVRCNEGEKRAVEPLFPAQDAVYRPTMDWHGAPSVTTVYGGSDGRDATIIISPTDPTSPIPIPATSALLIGALATLWRFRK